MTVCVACGCEKVQTVTWVEINTDVVHGGANSDSQDDQDNWCPNCNSHCGLMSKIAYDKAQKEKIDGSK